ncbi:hypothetical protein NLI96_g2555 [Meripilus lineatus]|uniref:C2H2-type domain-containing protein n=1 Tax=Meripilus lineatus TaxID=2056292 RepID=A0AAD5YLW1_9APHY|nr:hypothetical protein NLI96_g2555 [Physisporinus lineatus]
MAKSKAIPKATKFESGSTKASTKAGKAKEAILGEARWGNKTVMKRFQCDAVVGEGEDVGPCTSTFTRRADMIKHKRLHDPAKKGWYFCDHCNYKSAQKYPFDQHVKGAHGGRKARQIIFCMMKRRGKVCGWTCHDSSQMSHHRTGVHGGATSKESPRLTPIPGKEGEYTIPWKFRLNAKLKLPPGIYYDDQIPLQTPAEPSPSPLSPTLSSFTANSTPPFYFHPVPISRRFDSTKYDHLDRLDSLCYIAADARRLVVRR